MGSVAVGAGYDYLERAHLTLPPPAGVPEPWIVHQYNPLQ